RVTDLYSNVVDQLREQVRLVVEAVKEREEWELINHPKFGLLHEVVPSQRINTRKGTPTPDDFDELLTLVWKKPHFSWPIQRPSQRSAAKPRAVVCRLQQ